MIPRCSSCGCVCRHYRHKCAECEASLCCDCFETCILCDECALEEGLAEAVVEADKVP